VVRAHFDNELSFEAVGRKLTAAYRELLERERGRSQRRNERSALHIDHA
jgi:hypothetical protein